MHNDGSEFAKQINGQDGKTWQLPLAPLTASSQPECYSPGDNPPHDRALAAFRLVNNHTAVTKFAARGAGQKGPNPVWAPLADPSALPNEQAMPYVDRALNIVARALLEDVEADSVQNGLAELEVCFHANYIDCGITCILNQQRHFRHCEGESMWSFCDTNFSVKTSQDTLFLAGRNQAHRRYQGRVCELAVFA
jgi:hypothetical protein